MLHQSRDTGEGGECIFANFRIISRQPGDECRFTHGRKSNQCNSRVPRFLDFKTRCRAAAFCVSFLGLYLAFECGNFCLQFAEVMHCLLVFLRLVNLRLNLGNLLLDCGQYITSRALRPTLWVGPGFFNPIAKMDSGEH